MNRNESSSSRWSRIINEQRAGGLSIAEFCRRRSISPPSFFYWRRRLGPAGLARAAAAFVEVKVGPRESGVAVADAALELILRGGLRVLVRRGFDDELLRALLAALGPLESAESPESPEASA